MKCVIPGLNLKVFGRAIHSLSKIGDELYIEPLEEGLALRTVNSSRSAYACFMFSPSFFSHYDDGSPLPDSEDSDDERFRCKLAMKSILTVFRSLSTIEKTVEKCKIQLNNPESRLVFQLHCKHGIVKTHNLAFIECETLQAVFSKDLCPNVLTAPGKLLCDVVVNFQNSQEEITLIVNPHKVALKNYTDDELDKSKVVHTEMTLIPDEFDNCRIGVDTEITFCLKELRAILAFVEVTNLPLNIHFETPGRPVVFTVDSDQTFEASFVLATLAESEPGASQQPSQAKAKKQTRNNNSKRSHTSQTQKHKATPSTSRLTSAAIATRRPDSSSNTKTQSDLDRTEEEPVNINDDTIRQMDVRNTEVMDTNVTNTGAGGDMVRSRSRSPRPSSGSTQGGPSPVIPLQSEKNQQAVPVKPGPLVLQELEEEEEEEEEEVLPGTPPSKKFRSLFFGLSQSQPSQAPPPPGNILAADTDDED